MSRLALTPTNVPASATDISIPTLRAGDLYYNTTDGLKVYTGSAWAIVSSGDATLTEVDGGVFDSIAPYQGGSTPSIASTQTVNGGTP
jgi:hypothetical protein